MLDWVERKAIRIDEEVRAVREPQASAGRIFALIGR